MTRPKQHLASCGRYLDISSGNSESLMPDGCCSALFEATNDHNRVGGLIFGNDSDLPMTGC